MYHSVTNARSMGTLQLSAAKRASIARTARARTTVEPAVIKTQSSAVTVRVATRRQA